MSFMLLGILNAQASGGAAGAFDLLETINVTGSGVTISFTGLDAYSDYKHLQLRMVVGRNNSATTTANLTMTLNNDTGYAYHTLSGNGSSVSSSATSPSAADFSIKEVVGRDTANGIYGSAVIDILDFSSTNKNKTIRYLAGSNASAENTISLGSVLYLNTAAVTQINTLGYVDAGSRFSLYGVK